VADVKHPAASLYMPPSSTKRVDIDWRSAAASSTFTTGSISLAHYQLFGVEPSVDKKRSGRLLRDRQLFHPDRYFGKKWAASSPSSKKSFRGSPELRRPVTQH